MSNSERAWKRWGSDDPYYGVLSHDEFRRENLTRENLEKFFATGEEHVAHVIETLRSRFLPGFEPARVVDYGCGTGRLAIPFARRAAQVTGIDVAPAMRDETLKNAGILGVTNVEVLDVDEGLKRSRGADLIHSFIVFQHIPVKIGVPILRSLADALAPGGCIALHVTIGREASRMRKMAFWARHRVPLAHTLIQLALRRPVRDAPMQMNHYPLAKLFMAFRRAGIEDLYLETTDHAGFIGVIIYGRKRSSVG